MQDRYAGDVGDFGKFGMLRCLEKSGLSVGVNWYLVGDESHNNDGKHIGYITDKKFVGCDDALLELLGTLVERGGRAVSRIEELKLLSTDKYYHERLREPNEKAFTRDMWHKKALNTLEENELVFLDPDNGIIPKSVGRNSIKSVKYVLPEEIVDYYDAGHSVVFYSHRTREKIDTYLNRFYNLFEELHSRGAGINGIAFKRGTIRDYFFIMQEEHCMRIEEGIENLLLSPWNKHFELLPVKGMLDKK